MIYLRHNCVQGKAIIWGLTLTLVTRSTPVKRLFLQRITVQGKYTLTDTGIFYNKQIEKSHEDHVRVRKQPFCKALVTCC